ncbi:MAG TPA: hypothetical protein VM076_18535 [Gemmatimonadaceae bacterium]|nr:hypothetical protein [Gemmatimonadaceae bacterium]
MARKLADAQSLVPSYVEPRKCFVTLTSSKVGFDRIDGTPCAHYVSHHIALKGRSGNFTCNEKFLVRVTDLIARLGSPIEPSEVQVGDVWAVHEHGNKRRGTEPSSHCGVVFSVDRDAAAGTSKIMIRHCSSGQAKVATNDWVTHFHSSGAFYRVPPREASAASHANLSRFAKGFTYRAPFRPIT